MVNKELKKNISVVFTDKEYPNFPYDENSGLLNALLDLLEKLGLSRENPFFSYIRPGQVALIKPNWVRDRNPLGHNIDSLITHPSLIKYILDLLVVAMEGKGKVIIADAPIQNCDLEALLKKTKMREIVSNTKEKYPDLEIEIEDWRITTMRSSDARAQKIQDFKFSEEEAKEKGYELIDLSKTSFLEEISKYADKFRVTKYKSSLMRQHHSLLKHEYLVTKKIFEADFFINLPKIKTHIKAGLTGAMKNLVGINGHKEFLPHHIKGSPMEGGDNYSKSDWIKRRYEDLYDYVWENVNDLSPSIRKILMKALQILLKLSSIFGGDGITAGSWKGNNTIWRTTLDLNHIAYFKHEKPTKILNIVDGIIAGEAEGPLEPTPRPTGLLVAGENPALIDATLAQIMGYQISEIPTVDNALNHSASKFKTQFTPPPNLPNLKFKRPKFW